LALIQTAKSVGDDFPLLHAHKKRCSVWILPQLAAPETHPKLAHVVGGTVTQTEQTVNVPPQHSSTETAEPSFGNRRFWFGAVGSFTDDSTPLAARL
jgi:hypothetical protein